MPASAVASCKRRKEKLTNILGNNNSLMFGHCFTLTLTRAHACLAFACRTQLCKVALLLLLFLFLFLLLLLRICLLRATSSFFYPFSFSFSFSFNYPRSILLLGSLSHRHQASGSPSQPLSSEVSISGARKRSLSEQLACRFGYLSKFNYPASLNE